MTEFIFTCEHAGNLVPHNYAHLFKSHKSLLNSHRGYDIGIWDVFEYFSSQLEFQFYHTKITRLFIEFNRSLHNNNLFSEITNSLDKKTKEKIITDYYLPYRKQVKDNIEQLVQLDKKVIHISLHSFTPQLNGKVRNADIGFLYDPKSLNEKSICIKWREEISELDPKMKIRFNYPYLGIADGFTSSLRKEYGNRNYAGIELELNQRLLHSTKQKKYIIELLLRSFRQSIT